METSAKNSDNVDELFLELGKTFASMQMNTKILEKTVARDDNKLKLTSMVVSPKKEGGCC